MGFPSKFMICRSLLGRRVWLGLLLAALITPPVPVRAADEAQTTLTTEESAPAETVPPETPQEKSPEPQQKQPSAATPHEQPKKSKAPGKRPAKKAKRKKVIRYIGRKHRKSVEKKSGKTVTAETAKVQEPCGGERLTADQLTDAMKKSRSLAGKNLVGLSLHGFVLRNADLSGACLANANLERVDLRDANLERAVLSNANLHLATLQNANLYGAKLDGANLAEAIWTDGHICSKGSIGRCLDIFDQNGN